MAPVAKTAVRSVDMSSPIVARGRATGLPAVVPKQVIAPELTIAYICGRKDPRVEWMLDSLSWQISDERVHVIVVDFHGRQLDAARWPRLASLRCVTPKPTIWQGPHRITRGHWWAKSSASNTAIALCQTPWIFFLDDRLVLQPGWLARARAAITGGYVVCGTYEKRVALAVEGGLIAAPGVSIGRDARLHHARGFAPCGGGWLFGCCYGAPLEWLLEINGLEEGCDSLSSEDTMLGRMLENSGKPLRFDPGLAVIEDRSIEESAEHDAIDEVIRRIDKGASPRDKSHAALARFGSRQRTEFTPDLRALRAAIARGEAFPIPDPNGDYRDWYDGQPIRDMI